MNQSKELNKSLKLLVKASLFVFFGIFLSKLFTFLYSVIIARKFGSEIFGLFSLAIMILVWFVSFFSFGLYEGILRFIPFYRGKNNLSKIKYIFKFSIIILLFSSLVSGFILYFLADIISINIFHNPDLVIFLKILSLTMPFFILAYLFLAVIQAYERIKAHSIISDLLQNFIKVFFLIFFILIGLKTNAILFSYFLAILATFLISYFYCRHNLPEIFKKITIKNNLKTKLRKDLISYSWPFLFLGFLYGLLPYIDFLIIGYFKSASEVGIYNTAVLIAGLMILFPSLFARLFLPLITRQFSHKNYNVVKELSKQVEKWIFIVNLPFFLLMFIFPGTFISILFKRPEYMAAATSLKFLAIGFLFYSMSMIFRSLVSMIGRSKLILINTVIVSILNLILNLILVPKYGITGAAFATMISYIVFSLILFFQVKYYASIIPLKRKMLRVLTSVIIPTILLIYIKQVLPINLLTMFLQGTFFILSYLLLIFLTKSLDKNDLMILKSIKQKITNQ